MPTASGFDYAYRPDITPAMVKAAGGSFVMRYLSYDAWPKTTNRAEVAAMRAGGVGVGFVWESTADRPAFGAAAGDADGREAKRQADAIGIPSRVPLFYAMDTDERAYGAGILDTIRAYGIAFAKASGHFAFPYGSSRVIDAIGGGWQTEAWSGGAVSDQAYLLQRAAPSPHLADTDDNVLFNSYALWLPGEPVPATDASVPYATRLRVGAMQRAVGAPAGKTLTAFTDVWGAWQAHTDIMLSRVRDYYRKHPRSVSNTIVQLQALWGVKATGKWDAATEHAWEFQRFFLLNK